MKNSTTIVAALADSSAMSGPRMLFDLTTSTSTWTAGSVSSKGDAHDIQFSKDGSSIYQPVLAKYVGIRPPSTLLASSISPTTALHRPIGSPPHRPTTRSGTK